MHLGSLQEAARHLALFNVSVAEELSRLQKANSLPEACRAYKDLRDGYVAMDEHRKALNEQIERINHSILPELFTEAESTSITLEFPGDNDKPVKYRFTRSLRFTCSMLDKDQGKAWLRANGAGDLIQETVNAQTLSTFAKDLMTNDGKELPSEIFKTGTMPTTSITKA
jgi:hypothetical protein